MLNTNNISALDAPIGEDYGAIGCRLDDSVVSSNNIDAEMLCIAVEMIGNKSAHRDKKRRHTNTCFCTRNIVVASHIFIIDDAF